MFDVSESAYYVFVKRQKQPPKNLGLRVEVKALFERSKASAGSRSILSMLGSKAIKTTRHQVIKAMKEQNLISKQPSRKWRQPKPSAGARFDNKLQQQFNDSNALCADVTYVMVGNKWHYLSTVMHAPTRQLISWDLSDIQDAKLVAKTLNKAMLQFDIANKPDIFHSDQGSIYGSEHFVSCVQSHDLEQSMSKRGYCWDNAVMERWYRSFKSEWMPKRGYPDIQSATQDIADYVRYYNFERPHQKHDGLPPITKH